MPKLAANISLLFTEAAFLDRFGVAADAGFRAVEFLFPYAWPAERLADRLSEHGLTQVLFNLPPGDWEAGERGIACLPGREQEFADSVERALDYAEALDCPRLHVMAGIPPAGANKQRCRDVYLNNLRLAAERAATSGCVLTIEAINWRDIPGYHVSFQEDAAAVIEAVGEANLRLQFDIYHCQVMQGDVAMRLRALRPLLGHVQVAGPPERNEPDRGELNYAYLFRLLDELAYDGWVGCEYRPAGSTIAGLGWAAPYLAAGS